MSAVGSRTPEEIAVISRAAALAAARRSTRDYLPHCTVRSDDPARPEPVRLRPWPYQVALAERLDAHESMVILKSRQLGCSTFLRAYVGRRTAEEGWAVGYYSRGQEEAVAWLDGLEEMLSDLPPELRPRTRRTGNLLRINGGSVRVHPGTQAAGVSYTYQLVIADEAAHHPYGRENYANYSPTLSAGGQFIGLSTADPALGPSGWFYELWQGASNSTLPYSALFLGWGERPDRDAAWLAARRAELAGDEHAFRANYPESPEDAFLGREGLVYGWDELAGALRFAPARNVRPAPVSWQECRWRLAAIDPGGHDPTAIVALGVSEAVAPMGQRLHVYGELYHRGNIGALEWSEYLVRLHAVGPIDLVLVDPSQASQVATLRSLGWNAHPANNAKLERINTVTRHLMDGRLTISPECRNLIHEFETYWWKPRREGQVGGTGHETTTPAAHHADALDALGYAVLGAIKGLPRSPGVLVQRWESGMRMAPETLEERIARMRRESKRVGA